MGERRKRRQGPGNDRGRRRTRPTTVLTEADLISRELGETVRATRAIAIAASREFEHLTSGRAEVGLRAREGYVGVLGHMASWCQYVQRGVAALHRMEDAGDHFFAAPLRRSLIEHGVAMWTLAQEPGLHQSFVRGHQHSVGKMQDAMANVGLEPHPDTSIVLAWETDPATRPLDLLQHAKNRFDKFGDSGARLYVQWLHETWLSHAGFPTSVIYLRDTEGDDYPTLTAEAMVDVNAFGAEMTAADAMILALGSLGSICEDDPFFATVERLNRTKNELVSRYAAVLDRRAGLA